MREGDLLFTIDPRPYQAAVQAAQASVAESEATLAVSRTELTRASQLLRTQAVPDAAIRLADLVETLMTQKVRA